MNLSRPKMALLQAIGQLVDLSTYPIVVHHIERRIEGHSHINTIKIHGWAREPYAALTVEEIPWIYGVSSLLRIKNLGHYNVTIYWTHGGMLQIAISIGFDDLLNSAVRQERHQCQTAGSNSHR